MSEKNDELLIEKIRESIDYLDSLTDVPVPDMAQIDAIMAEAARRKKREWLEFGAFLLCAFALLGIIILISIGSILYFAVLQGILFISIPIGAGLWLRRERKQVKAQ